MFKRTLQSSVVVRLRSVGDRDGRVSLYFTHNPTILREGEIYHNIIRLVDRIRETKETKENLELLNNEIKSLYEF